ncbi:phosphohydrolase [Candidatus Epulonipiscium fishelsonii]|uniref:Phosphohydrolase n=1 Tax=Candidatus Epulonipiscium fishelsonii TaxID=77094 RepID=A0ACC8XE23_9FIRM|nr:phosphohydrolase [Epulopiscium sp. SCG-B05WGA-EpuloA1]ONI41230.1 phosphohydrolase [Epulopiscium sp. SCG-B11WGA-EpuloA1]
MIADLKPPQQVKAVYLCKSRQLLKNKNGKEYYALKVQDASGVMDAKVWSINASIADCKINDIIYVEGEVVLFQNNLQLNVFKLTIASEDTYKIEDLIPKSKVNLESLQTKLLEFIDSVQNEKIKQLLEIVFYDDNILEKFITHPAGKSVHHAYLNGLLEHTITVTKIGTTLSQYYNHVNKDLVIAGCLLHDIGKLYELSNFPQIDYTDEGQLLGHIMIGLEKVTMYINQIPDFSAEYSLVLKHIIASHHGELEYGSPQTPKCIEAMIVHLSDYSDSKIKMIEEMLDESKEVYVGYNKILNRNIRRTKSE